MTKIKLLKTIRTTFLSFSVAVIALFVVFASFPLTPFAGTAVAAGTTFAFYYNEDAAAKVKLVQELKDAKNTSGPIMSTTKILVKDGPGSKDSVLNYDLETTNKYNKRGGVADDKGEYFWSKWFYCGTTSKKITDTAPADKKEKYIKMLYTVSLDMGDGDKADQMINEYKGYSGSDSHAGVTVAQRITPSDGGGAGNATESIYDHREGGAGTNDIDDKTNEITPPECRPGGRGDIQVNNYGKMNSGDKDKWKAQVAVAKANPNASPNSAEGGGDPDATQADCDAKWSSPLSWIICPIIDMGAGLTDYVFTDIVSPLLKDIPIKAEGGDPGFIAWQNFRLLGNLLLLGSLMAVVYSQARGK